MFQALSLHLVVVVDNDPAGQIRRASPQTCSRIRIVISERTAEQTRQIHRPGLLSSSITWHPIRPEKQETKEDIIPSQEKSSSLR